MLSSTSNSEKTAAQATRWLGALLIALLVLAIAIEAATRIGFVRLSRIQRRIQAEHVAARQMRPVASNGQETVLLVGNSLILEDIAMPALQNLVSDAASPSRYVVENTQFLDWYFALQRLFREGLHPGRILLGLSPNQLASSAILGEYFGHYMMSGRNVVDAAAAANLDSTEASNLLFANWSAWIGSKSDVRKWVVAHVIPDTARLAEALATQGSKPPPLRGFSELIDARVAGLKALSRANGVEIAILLMPDPKATDEDTQIVQEAGDKARVGILVPAAMKEIPLSHYRDGFHLNEQGAGEFTEKLSIVLRKWMTQRDADFPVPARTSLP